MVRSAQRRELWRMTFAAGRELDSDEMLEILQKTNAKAVGLHGKVVGSNRHDYNIYTSDGIEPLPREGIQYLKDQGFAVTMTDAPDREVAAELFPIEYVVKTIKGFG